MKNKGLCKLVAPSVVATVLSTNMNYPETLSHNTATECEYLAKEGTSAGAIIRFDTDSSGSAFAKNERVLERRGLHIGPLAGLGDEAYYFYEQAGKASVTTVVVLQGSLQLLTTGTGTLNQIGSIAHYALNQFETKHPPKTPSSS